jgi:hypothetical protein
LPLISGCSSESLEAGKIVESFETKAALELLRLGTRSFMQTRFQIREISLAKGYCLAVTDKNHTQVAFAFENLDAQLQRLEQLLVYSDDSKQELATVNLMVQRNIPVTFAKPAADVINETFNPALQPRVMKAVPLGEPPKFGTFSAAKPVDAAPAPKKPAAAAAKSHPKASPAEVRRAVPIEQEKGKKN